MEDYFSVPSEERDKLFPFVPITLIFIVIYASITLGILLFDFQGGYSTNPVVFYSIPFLYAVIALSRDEIPVIFSILGVYFQDTKSKVIGAFSIPVGLLFGWFLVQIITVKGAFIKISTYPWAITTLSTASTLSTFTTGTNFFLYMFVAIFEEASSILMGKNFANWFNKKGLNPLLSCGIGYFMGRIVLTLYHWFSYNGLEDPSLYISALVLFLSFTLLGIITGVVIQGFQDKFSDFEIIPICILPMISAHFIFDFLLSQLMIIG